MLLINSKTGKAEEISEDDIAEAERKQSKKSSFRQSGRGGFSQKNAGESSFGRKSSSMSKRSDFEDVDAPEKGEITRTSDNKKTSVSKSSSGGFGRAKFASDRGDDFESTITRTSEQKKAFGSKSKTSFGKKKAEPIEGDFSRTSDRKPLYKKVDDYKKEKPTHSSKSYAVWLLSKREYSAKDLIDKIVGRGYSAEEGDEALAFVIANKYQSDERYAGLKARDMERSNGNMRVMMKLKEKGIPIELAQVETDNLGSEESRAVTVAEKFKREIAKEGLTQKLKAKIYRFLAYRGFSTRSVKMAIESLVPGHEEDNFDPHHPD
jgi:regulatory protein